MKFNGLVKHVAYDQFRLSNQYNLSNIVPLSRETRIIPSVEGQRTGLKIKINKSHENVNFVFIIFV